ncbi:serpin family protein [Candidatus Woesearchaeota archaeon]|nr:serpin family protein [Candidatus Woesearchaeota archaeon]
MNKKIFTIGIALLIVAVVGATAALFLFPYQPDQPPRADDTGFTQEGIDDVVSANNQFALELYSDLAGTEGGNIFFSPYSISAALAMTYEGAKGQTAEEIKYVFHFPEEEILRPNFAAIYNSINEDGKEYELSTGNALWAQYDYKFLEDYTSRVEKYYGGKAANLDFIDETEESREIINTFIEKQTKDKIKDLIPTGVLSPMTRLVLTNAVYFKGTWKNEFDRSDTRDMDFKVTPDKIVKTPMMYMKSEKALNYAELDTMQILELPYKGDDVSMLILLPKQGEAYDSETGESVVYDYSLEDIELTPEKLEIYRMMAEFRSSGDITVYLPKFEFDAKYSLADKLIAMGMPTAFGFGADFSGMDGTHELYISSVIHQAYVKVDEKGTEAAAATAVSFGATSAIKMPKIFRADHPFIFIIQQKKTGNILFMGRMTDPTMQ